MDRLHPVLAGINSSEIKLHNLSAILLSLLYNGNISRVSLARMIGVSTATVTNLVAELVAQGLIIEVGLMRSGDQPLVGRPQKALQLVPDARFAIGIHIDVGRVHLALTNLQGDVLHKDTLEHDLTTPWEHVMDAVVDGVEAIIAQHTVAREIIVGVGVAASGLVDVTTGVNLIAPNLDWHDVPIGDYLGERLGLPIMVENNVRAMALGEALFSHQDDGRVMAFIYVRMGVGAGLVINGQLYRGAHAGAGEIGHTLIAVDDARQVQSLEDLFSEPAIKRLAQAHLQAHPHSPLAQTVQAQGLTMRAIFMAAQQDVTLHRLLEERAFYFGIALANLVNVFNPEVIVLGGIFTREQGVLLPTVRETLRCHAFANLSESVRLEVTEYGQDAGVLGASALALDAFFYRPKTQTTTPT